MKLKHKRLLYLGNICLIVDKLIKVKYGEMLITITASRLKVLFIIWQGVGWIRDGFHIKAEPSILVFTPTLNSTTN